MCFEKIVIQTDKSAQGIPKTDPQPETLPKTLWEESFTLLRTKIEPEE